jgi:hypothetical protein
MADREAFWRRQFALWKKSGLSITAYCRKKGLTESGFRLWQRAVKARNRRNKNLSHSRLGAARAGRSR